LSLEQGALLEGRDERETACLKDMAVWARNFLTRPHPALGRPGAGCPWVEKSIQRRLYHLTLMHEAHLRVDAVKRTFHVMREHFLRLEPTAFSEAQFKTLVTIFTGLPFSKEQEAEFISGLHEHLKPSFVSEGLMLGEFYPNNLKTGLRNPAWHPLRASPPMLVIRCMVKPDIAFLHDRKEFILAYLHRFQQEGGTEVRNFAERNRARLRREERGLLLETLREFEQSRAA
jgi:hypothetical protein